MALSDGDYISCQSKVVEALLADTGSGGLRETGAEPVKTIEAELRSEPRAYRDHEVPAIAVCILSKEDRHEGTTTLKVFRLGFFIYCRGLDLEAEVATCQKIAHRLEVVLDDENLPGKQFGSLPSLIEGAQGALTSEVRRTEFLQGGQVERGQKTYGVMGLVESDISIPT